jgi:hypothetical protein
MRRNRTAFCSCYWSSYLLKYYENLIRFVPIAMLILPMPAQALDIAIFCSPLKEGKALEEVMHLAVLVVV